MDVYPEFGATPPLRFAGETKPLVAVTFAVDSTADAARLKSLLSDLVAYATQVRTAADAMAAELEREPQQKVAAIGQLLSAGTVSIGSYTDPFRKQKRLSFGKSPRPVASLRSGAMAAAEWTPEPPAASGQPQPTAKRGAGTKVPAPGHRQRLGCPERAA